MNLIDLINIALMPIYNSRRMDADLEIHWYWSMGHKIFLPISTYFSILIGLVLLIEIQEYGRYDDFFLWIFNFFSSIFALTVFVKYVTFPIKMKYWKALYFRDFDTVYGCKDFCYIPDTTNFRFFEPKSNLPIEKHKHDRGKSISIKGPVIASSIDNRFIFFEREDALLYTQEAEQCLKIVSRNGSNDL